MLLCVRSYQQMKLLACCPRLDSARRPCSTLENRSVRARSQSIVRVDEQLHKHATLVAFIDSAVRRRVLNGEPFLI